MTISLWYADRPRNGQGRPTDILDFPGRYISERVPRLFDAVRGAIATLRRIRRRQATMRELGKLDDRMLRDVGVYRGEIWSISDALARDEGGPGRRVGLWRRG